jgi:hypothetical protein
MPPGSAAIPVTESEKYELEKTGIRFMDVTEDDLEAVYAELQAAGRLQTLASCMYDRSFLFPPYSFTHSNSF